MLLHQKRGAELARIGGAQWVTGQHPARAETYGKYVGHFVPVAGEGFETSEHLATLGPATTTRPWFDVQLRW